MELQGERLIEASRVHARPFSGSVGAVGAVTGVGASPGMGQPGGHTGEMHQGAAAGGMPGACTELVATKCREVAAKGRCTWLFDCTVVATTCSRL